ncbi:ATP F0F1 synthase subunit B [Zavarzinia sp.]|uniref:F0F1 ATP synthase subunit B family protein n=1 Tax=Zavarzinia sp. TaxID=2027920 RepID=UPI00356B0A64
MSEILSNPETWVAVSFVLFFGLVVYLKVPGLLGKVLDDRAAKIKADLDAAAKLKAEAEAALAKYREATKNAGKEAEAIVVEAKAVAEALAAKAEEDLTQALARRVELGKAKIAQAEANAIAEVRKVAAEAAVAAARELIATRLDPIAKERLIGDTITSMATRLN